MVSIGGISLKKLKKYKDHEGLTIYSGDIYLGKKKIAEWEQDYMAGPDHFNFINPDIEAIIDKKIRETFKEKTIFLKNSNGEDISIPYSLELLISDLLILIEREKKYKQAISNKGGGILIVTDGSHEIAWQLLNNANTILKEDLYESFVGSKRLEAAKKEAGFLAETEDYKHEIFIYTSPSDFIIGPEILL